MRLIELGKEQVSMMNPPNEGELLDKQGQKWRIGRTGDGSIILRSNGSHPEFLPGGKSLQEFCQWINDQAWKHATTFQRHGKTRLLGWSARDQNATRGSISQSLRTVGKCSGIGRDIKPAPFMTLTQMTRFEQLRIWHPLPWYLDQCNDSGVCVKDSKGETVFLEDFGTIPDEMDSGSREQIIAGASTLAWWLVAWSEQPFGWLTSTLSNSTGAGEFEAVRALSGVLTGGLVSFASHAPKATIRAKIASRSLGLRIWFIWIRFSGCEAA
jgi:hypothetical protein